MNPTSSASALMDTAASHLRAAADHADRHADAGAHDDCASSLCSGLAGQLRLVSAGLSPSAPILKLATSPLGIQDHLDAAIASLDRIAPLDGPPDLQLWAWRVVDLCAQLESLGSRQ